MKGELVLCEIRASKRLYQRRNHIPLRNLIANKYCFQYNSE